MIDDAEVLLSALLGMCCRSEASKSMVQRITDEVNATLAQEAGQHQLSEKAVLDLIDQGASQGGPEVCSQLAHLLLCMLRPLVLCMCLIFALCLDI